MDLLEEIRRTFDIDEFNITGSIDENINIAVGGITIAVVNSRGEIHDVRPTMDAFQYVMAQCTPSREDLLTGVKWETGRSGRWNINDPEVIPVEEDSVFAPRKVEVECVA